MSNWTATDTADVILAADDSRNQVIIQLYEGSDVYFAFGSDAVAGEGLRITSLMPVIVIDDYRASLAISVVCASGGSASGGFEVSEFSYSGVTYQDLIKEVGGYLGYGYEPLSWTEQQLSEIDGHVQSGVRMFYHPPAIQGVEPGYEWTFLRPTATLVTVAGQKAYNLPLDYSRIIGGMYFDPVEHLPSVAIVGIGRMLEVSQNSDLQGKPSIVATRIRSNGDSLMQQQLHEALLWPTPDGAYTMTYEYDAYVGRLNAIRRFPLGGQKYAETIIAACLAAAEMRANDQRGIHWENFASQLASSISSDRKVGALHYGFVGDRSGHERMFSRREFGSAYPVTYKGETW